jgi:hypothetical protein
MRLEATIPVCCLVADGFPPVFGTTFREALTKLETDLECYFDDDGDRLSRSGDGSVLGGTFQLVNKWRGREEEDEPDKITVTVYTGTL